MCEEAHYEQGENCNPCFSGCKVCSTSSNCTVCYGNNRDPTNNCQCLLGFYENGANCDPCILGCSNCSNDSSCDTCFDPLKKANENCLCNYKYDINIWIKSILLIVCISNYLMEGSVCN